MSNKKTRFAAVPTSVDFPAQEEQILAFWEEGQHFARSVAERPEDKPFIFYDGPPFASGLPHYGHLLASIIKDVVPRYWTMRGFRVERRFGRKAIRNRLSRLVRQRPRVGRIEGRESDLHSGCVELTRIRVGFVVRSIRTGRHTLST